jgi:hypothetical protein
MARTMKIETGWEDEAGESYRVTLEMTPGEAPSRDCPGCGPEFEVVEVREDKVGGVLRPDLIDAVDRELEGRWGDEVACEAQDIENDAARSRAEDRWDAERDERALAGRA